MQVVVLLVIQGTKGSHLTIAIRSLKFILIFQYLPRVSRVYSFLKKVRWSSGILPDSAGAKAIFNLFLYLLASHVSSCQSFVLDYLVIFLHTIDQSPLIFMDSSHLYSVQK